MKKNRNHPLIIGTLILTATGFISRIIGFFYRIYLSRLFGEEGMGIYQLLNPVLALSFSLTAAGYQTAISKLMAEHSAKEHRTSFLPLAVGLSISLPLSFLCSSIIFGNADFIAGKLLLEPRTASMLRILSFSIPLGAVHSCINGYFYGMKKTAVPALSQLLEQIARVSCVYIVSAHALSEGKSPSINVAVLGLAAGELFSMTISVIAVYLSFAKDFSRRTNLPSSQKHRLPTRFNAQDSPNASDTFISFLLKSGTKGKLLPAYKSILAMAFPLTANRLVLNLLGSIESVSIPAKLRLYGYDTSTALSVYGVLTGMAMPLIFFPNALTNSISVLLLPTISESYALGDTRAVKRASLRTVKYCGLLGCLCMCMFLLLGKWAGNILFHSALAGHFIQTLSFICPFIYLDTTLSSILHGLGMAGRVFIMNVVCMLLRLSFIFFTVPHVGITGYLWGMLASQLILSVLYLSCLFLFLRDKN